MEFTSLNEGKDFLAYPGNKIIGILSTSEELHATVTELNNAGFQKERVQVLHGEKGAERLDVAGERHGLLAKVYRTLQKVGAESKLLSEYESELRDGHFLLAVDVSGEEERAQVLNIFNAHGGHRIIYYGRLTIERLSS